MTPTKTTATHLRPAFSAIVRTDKKIIVPTMFGNVEQPEEVLVKAGGALPENLADGEYARLEALGAFEPYDQYAVVRAGFATFAPGHGPGAAAVEAGQRALGALPGDEPKTTADIRFPTEAEVDATARLQEAQEAAASAVAEAAAEAATPNDVDEKPAARRGK